VIYYPAVLAPTSVVPSLSCTLSTILKKPQQAMAFFGANCGRFIRANTLR